MPNTQVIPALPTDDTVQRELAALPVPLRARLETLMAALTIHSSTRFQLAGLEPMTAVSGEPLERALAARMEACLYGACYARDYDACRRSGTLTEAVAFSVPERADASLVERLSQAHSTVTRWDGAWVIHRADPSGVVHVGKGDAHRVALPGSYMLAWPGEEPSPGMTVNLLVTRESLRRQPGAIHLYSDALMSSYDEVALARVYLNLAPPDRAQIIGALSGGLNELQVPYRIKVQIWPRNLARSDSTVLYLPRRFLPIALRVLASVSAGVDGLMDPVPLFTKRLARGIGAAEDSGTGESFGQARIRLLCQAVLDTWRQGSQDTSARLEAMVRIFARHGLSLCRPYLNPGDEDPFSWPSLETS